MSFTGTSTVVELARLPGWDPRAGTSYQRRWQGPPAAVATQAGLLKAAGIKYQIEEPHGNGSYQLVTGYFTADEAQPPGEAIADNWDLDGEDLEKSLWEHPKTLAIFTQIKANAPQPEWGGQNCARLKSWIESLARNEAEAPPWYWPSPATSGAVTEQGILNRMKTGNPGSTTGSSSDFGAELNSTLQANLRLLVRDIAAGVESWPVSRYVLRHTLTVALGTTIRPNYVNVGEMSSSSALVSDEALSFFLLDVLPEGYWLKRTPRTTQTGPGRWNIVQEWWHADAYSAFIYDP